MDRYRAERERWIAANSRTDHTDPCAACGAVGGEQRRTGPGTQLLATSWLCVACTEAVEQGWGTSRVLTPARNACLTGSHLSRPARRSPRPVSGRWPSATG